MRDLVVGLHGSLEELTGGAEVRKEFNCC